MKRSVVVFAVLAAIGFAPVVVRASDWQPSGGGDWHDNDNWSAGIPDAAGATANFIADISADATVNLDAPATVGSMTIADGGADYYSYIISGANTLTFDNGGSSAALTVSRGTANLVGAPVALNDNLSLQLSNASRIEFSGQLSGSGQMKIGPSGTESTPNTYVRLSADNSSYDAGFELLGGANGASPRLEIAHTNALGSGAITGVNWHGGWLANVTGGPLTLTNTINGTRMWLHGDPFVLAGDIDLTSTIGMFTYANVTLPNGLPNDLTLVGYSGSTVKIEGASAGDLTISSSANEAFRLEFDHDDGLGPNDGVALGAALRATLVPLGGPRTIGKSFSAHTWSVDSSENLTLTGDISTTHSFGKAGTGLVVLSGANNTWGTLVQLNGGVLRPETASAMPTSNIRFGGSGGVLELTPVTGDFTNSVGSSAGQVQWNNNSGGGFSAHGGDRFVNLGGASAPLTWNWNSFVGNTSALRLNSVHADSVIEFQNPIDLRSSNENTLWRTVYVDDNPNSTNDYAVMSGLISNSVASRGLIKLGPGKLVLTGDNTYTLGAQIQEGTLMAGHANALGTAGTITVSSNATLAVGQSVTFAPGTRTMTFDTGAILAGQGTYDKAGSWTTPAGLILKPGLPSGVLTVDMGGAGETLTLGADNALQAVIQSDGVTTGKLVVDGALDISAVSARLVVSGTTPASDIVLAEALSLTGTFQEANVDLTGLSKPAQITYTPTQILLGPAPPAGTVISIQ